MSLIITRPNYDPTTRYISAWAKEVIDFAKARGIEAIDLEGEKANKDDFEGRIKKLEPRSVFLNGHGNHSGVTGQNHKPLVVMGENESVLAGKITYALSCESAKGLGESVAAQPDSTYIGYKEEFVFLASASHITKPLEDPKARPFMESSNQVMLSLLKGNTAGEASQKSRLKFRDHLIKLSSSASDPEAEQAMQFLRWNMIHQVCLGDGNATIR